MTNLVVDTSALVAVALHEPGCDRIIETLGATSTYAGIGAPTLVELGMVLTSRLGEDGPPAVTGMLAQFEVAAIPFVDAHWRAAVDGFARFGRGRHPASLNFGDCLTYAVARVAEAPLLFVGDDFARTDLAIA